MVFCVEGDISAWWYSHERENGDADDMWYDAVDNADILL